MQCSNPGGTCHEPPPSHTPALDRRIRSGPCRRPARPGPESAAGSAAKKHRQGAAEGAEPAAGSPLKGQQEKEKNKTAGKEESLAATVNRRGRHHPATGFPG